MGSAAGKQTERGAGDSDCLTSTMKFTLAIAVTAACVVSLHAAATDPTDPTTIATTTLPACPKKCCNTPAPTTPSPTTNPSNPTTKPTNPTTKPTNPTTKPTVPTTTPTVPTTTPTVPTTTPTNPYIQARDDPTTTPVDCEAAKPCQCEKEPDHDGVAGVSASLLVLLLAGILATIV